MSVTRSEYCDGIFSFSNKFIHDNRHVYLNFLTQIGDMIYDGGGVGKGVDVTTIKVHFSNIIQNEIDSQ